jgi:hypothetical protein
VVVDEGGSHGTLASIKEELAAVGLKILSEESLTRIPTHRTEIAYLVCKKSVFAQTDAMAVAE